MTDTKLVRATEMGFYNGSMIAPGTQFRVPIGFKAKWVVDASTPEVKKPEVIKDEPTTLAELGKGTRRKPIGLQPAVPLIKE